MYKFYILYYDVLYFVLKLVFLIIINDTGFGHELFVETVLKKLRPGKNEISKLNLNN